MTHTWWGSLRSTLKDVLSSPPWWKQQGWIVVTEILMGFLAVWGLLQSLSPLWVGLGLGTVYAVNALSLWHIRVYGQKAGIVIALAGIFIVVFSLFFGGDFRAIRWYGLCAGIGVLLAFRDNQSVTATAWIPLRAHKRGGNNLSSLTFTSICSAILLAVSLYASGVITHHWKWWPHLMVVVGYGFFVPQMVAQMGTGMGLHHPAQWRPAEKKEMSWLLKLGTIFNAVNFLGRRLIIPAMILTLAQEKFGSEDALPVLGATLGLIGVLGSLARAPVVLVGNTSASSLLKWGARLSLLGWAMLSISLLLLGSEWGNTSIIMGVLILGWAMMEFTNRTWAIAYMEQLRLWTVGPRFSAARAHRRSLHRFMVRRASGGAVGCAVGGIVGPALAPAMVVILLAGCWWWLEKMPSEKHTQP